MKMKMKTHRETRHGGKGRSCRMMDGRGEARSGGFGAGLGREGGFRPNDGEDFGGNHGRRFHGGHGRGRGRGGRGRMFGGGELRLLLLRLVADESRHGYELIKAIEELTGGAYAPSPGIVYPTLSLLVDEGALEQQGETASRKAFAATEAGRAELAEKAEAADALIARLRGMAEAQERHDSPPIRRAVGNLLAALRNRAGAETFETETVHGIVDILDEAARRIERL